MKTSLIALLAACAFAAPVLAEESQPTNPPHVVSFAAQPTHSLHVA